MSTVCLVGSTGLVGSHIYTTLSKHPAVNTIYAYSRKELPISEKLKPLLDRDSTAWPKQYPSGAALFISGLGTTRPQAGSLENQRKIDYDLNLDLAKAAKEAGTKHYVLISSRGASSSSMFAYPRMKGELEDAVRDLGFEHCIILRPGLLVGTREDSRPAEFMAQKVAGFMGAISGNRLKDIWAQDADLIGRVAVGVGLNCIDGKEEEKFRILTQADILKLGRTEWKE